MNEFVSVIKQNVLVILPQKQDISWQIPTKIAIFFSLWIKFDQEISMHDQ